MFATVTGTLGIVLLICLQVSSMLTASATPPGDTSQEENTPLKMQQVESSMIDDSETTGDFEFSVFDSPAGINLFAEPETVPEVDDHKPAMTSDNLVPQTVMKHEFNPFPEIDPRPDLPDKANSDKSHTNEPHEVQFEEAMPADVAPDLDFEVEFQRITASSGSPEATPVGDEAAADDDEQFLVTSAEKGGEDSWAPFDVDSKNWKPFDAAKVHPAEKPTLSRKWLPVAEPERSLSETEETIAPGPKDLKITIDNPVPAETNVNDRLDYESPVRNERDQDIDKLVVEERIPSPQLLFKVSVPQEVPLGQPCPIVFTVKNTGSVAVAGVILRTDLPVELSHRKGQALDYTFGRLAPGETRAARLIPLAAKIGRAVNRAEIVAKGQVLQKVANRLAVVRPIASRHSALPANIMQSCPIIWLPPRRW